MGHFEGQLLALFLEEVLIDVVVALDDHFGEIVFQDLVHV